MTLERDHQRDNDRVLEAHMARAETEAQRILHAALEQAALLQVEMSKEVEEQTRRRLSMAEREIAERMAAADEEAEERVRQSVDTAAALLLNARNEADKIRDERDAAARVEAEENRRPRPPASGEVDALLDEAQQAALARVSEADAFAEERIAETAEWCKQHLAEADQLGTQRLLEAETRARAIIEQARAEAATIALPRDEPASPEDRAPPDIVLPDAPPPPDLAPPDLAPPDLTSPDLAPSNGRRRLPRLGKTSRVVLLVVVSVMGADLLRSCIAEPYTVASTSMEPEFHDGDRVVVNKFVYRLGDVKRGDIVVFDTSRVASTHQLGSTLVKRVIGKPGDEVQAVDGQMLVNGEPLDEPWLHDVETPSFGPVQVPDDSVFLLGDNRLTSVDSRTFGAVPLDAVVGRVDVVLWPPGDAGPV